MSIGNEQWFQFKTPYALQGIQRTKQLVHVHFYIALFLIGKTNKGMGFI